YLKTVNQIVGEKLDEIDRTKFDARDYDAALKLFRLEIDERKSQGDPSLENEINDPVAHYDKIAERFRRALDVVSPGLWSEKTQNERLATVESITSKFEAERLLETLFREKFGDPKDDPAVQDLHTAFRAANPGRDLAALKDALRGLVSGDGNLGGAVAPFLANMKAGLPPQDGRRAELIGAMVEGPLSEGRLEPLAAIRLARTIRDASPDRLEKLSNPAGFAREIREGSFSTPSGAGKSPAVLFCERALAQTAAKSGAAALLAPGNPPAPNAFGQTVAQLAAARCRARLEAIKDDPAALAAFEDELEVELAQTLDVVLTELQVVAPDLADLADAFELAAPTQLDVAAAGKSDGAFTAFLAEMRERRQIAQELEKNAAALLPQGANLDQGVVRRLCALAAGRAFAVALSRTRVGGAPAAPTLRGEWDKVARDAKSADDFAGLAGQARERAMVLGRAYFRAFTGVRLVQERTLERLEKEIDRRLTPEERTAYLAPDRLNDVTGDVVRTVEAAMAAAERAGSGDEGIDGELTRELARLDGKVAGRVKRLADGLRTAAEIDAIVPGAGTLCSDAVMGRGTSARLLGLVLQGVKDLKARKHDFEKIVAENEMRPEDFALALAREIAAVAQEAFVNGFDQLNEENAQNARDAYLKENPGADLDDVAVKEAISGAASVNALGTPDRVACMALTMEIAKLLMPDVMVHLTGLPSEQVQQVAQTLNDDAQRTAGDLTELTFEVQTRLYGEGVEGALSMSENELSQRMTVGELQQYEQLQKRAPAALMEQTVSKVLSHE
ncbi:MAG: hypothetical protein MJ138_08300, partial [Kiritimatiellae bacterium]|nr:hypothetical protein [Kiritimatiellia bacterium]